MAFHGPSNAGELALARMKQLLAERVGGTQMRMIRKLNFRPKEIVDEALDEEARANERQGLAEPLMTGSLADLRHLHPERQAAETARRVVRSAGEIAALMYLGRAVKGFMDGRSGVEELGDHLRTWKTSTTVFEDIEESGPHTNLQRYGRVVTEFYDGVEAVRDDPDLAKAVNDLYWNIGHAGIEMALARRVAELVRKMTLTSQLSPDIVEAANATDKAARHARKAVDFRRLAQVVVAVSELVRTETWSEVSDATGIPVAHELGESTVGQSFGGRRGDSLIAAIVAAEARSARREIGE